MSRAAVIEHYMGHRFSSIDIVAGDLDDRHRQFRKWRWSIYGDQTVNTALEQQPRIFVDQIGFVAVTDNKVKVSLLKQIVFDTA